jgi:hypothetical protein
MKNDKQIRLKELLCQLFEGECERLPGENDEDFLQRCGNMDFQKMDTIRYNSSHGIFTQPISKENKKK